MKNKNKIAIESYKNYMTYVSENNRGFTNCTWCVEANTNKMICIEKLKENKIIKKGKNILSQEEIMIWLRDL